MTKSPLLNAAAAAIYIAAIVTFLQLGSARLPELPEFLAAMMMLSVLVLSVLIMGTIFFLQPLQLYLDGQKRESVSLFLKSAGYFAAIVVVFVGTTLLLALGL